MKTQKIILEAENWVFQKNVQTELDNGWRVIPNTLVIMMDSSAERYIVFLEKD